MSKRTTKRKTFKKVIAVIPPEPEDKNLWPDETLPPMKEITKETVRQQMGSLYGHVNEAALEKVTEEQWSRFEFDTPYSKYYNIERLGVPGKFTLLREWTWPERFDVLERCHQAWERNPLARAGVEWTNHFVVGAGGQIHFRAAEIRDIVNEFREDPTNDIAGAERESCTGLQVDGEVLYRFYSNRQGRTTIVPIRPWHIHWINTDKGNYKDKVSYHYVYTIYRSDPGASDFGIEDVPAKDMVHATINKYPYELRGRPDLFSILPWLKAHRDFLEERARLNRRKTIYYTLTVKNATPGQVSATQAKFKVPPAPGSIIVMNENMKLESVESHINAEQALEDGRQIKLMAISGMLLPEFYFADGANSTLASATAQSLPALRKFSDYQDILQKQVWIPIYQKVIQNAVDAGRIPEILDEIDENGKPTKNKIRAIDAFSYEYPEIKEKDPLNLAKAFQIYGMMGLVSRATMSAKAGFDPVKEQEKIKLESQSLGPVPAQKTAPATKTSDDKSPKSDKSVTPIAPDSPQGQLQDRQLMPSPAAPEMPGNSPPTGGSG